MKRNIGSTDKVIRLLGGIALVLIGYFLISSVFLKTILIIIGVISIVESFTGYCYLYKLAGINTNRR